MIASRRSLVPLLIALFSLATDPAQAERTRIERGVNLFSVEQDVEIGRESAAEAEKELKLVRDREVVAYVNEVGRRVAKVSIEPGYPYEFKVIDAGEINAFALPGGFVYLNRGVIEAAADESELAGVLAHEVAHAAARHGTNQLSKQVMVQMPLALVMGSVLKGEGGWKGSMAKLGVNLGMSAVFLSYGRKAETQADVLATQQLFDAGYDPDGMARFFRKMEKLSKGEPSKLERFFSSHPVPEDREARVSQEARLLGPPPGDPVRQTRAFQRVQARLLGETSEPEAARGSPRVPPPDRRTVRWRHPEGFFRVSVPRNWQAQDPFQGTQITFAPGEASQSVPGQLTHGFIARFLMLGIGRRGRLEDAFDRQIDRLLEQHPDLSERRRARRWTVIEGADSLETVLEGEVRAGGYAYRERVWVSMRPLTGDADFDTALFLAIAPEADAEAYRRTFEAILGSCRFR